MSGRHSLSRTTTTRTRLAVTAAVGAAVTAPLALAGVASAAPAAAAQKDSTWDRIAQCESTGNWHAKTGNGYQGGLQFTPSTWKAYGGQKFAPSADKASREQQIAVAKKIQADQGWKAWPNCSGKSGAA
jgi:hypothetical protein